MRSTHRCVDQFPDADLVLPEQLRDVLFDSSTSSSLPPEDPSPGVVLQIAAEPLEDRDARSPSSPVEDVRRELLPEGLLEDVLALLPAELVACRIVARYSMNHVVQERAATSSDTAMLARSTFVRNVVAKVRLDVEVLNAAEAGSMAGAPR